MLRGQDYDDWQRALVLPRAGGWGGTLLDLLRLPRGRAFREGYRRGAADTYGAVHAMLPERLGPEWAAQSHEEIRLRVRAVLLTLHALQERAARGWPDPSRRGGA